MEKKFSNSCWMENFGPSGFFLSLTGFVLSRTVGLSNSKGTPVAELRFELQEHGLIKAVKYFIVSFKVTRRQKSANAFI